MSSYDNEIYRGPPEAGPTLERDIRPYGSDVYIVRSEKTTLAQDVPATQEPSRQESTPVAKKESKIAKAMKLLASCTAAVAIAATLTGAPAQDTVQADLQEWPQFSQVSADSGLAFRTVSENSHICQVSVSGWCYRFEALQEGLYMSWHESYDYSLDGVTYGGFYLHMQNSAEDWGIILDFSLAPHNREDPEEALGTIQPAGSDPLYIRAFFTDSPNQSAEYLQSIIDNLSDYVRIVNATEDGWGKVFIGETILSDTSLQWNGRMTVNSDFWSINRIHYASDHGFIPSEAPVHRDINGIHWAFFCAPSQYGEPLIWAVPSHEDLALGIDPGPMLHQIGLSYAMMEEDPYILETNLEVFADIILEQGLRYYHPADTSVQTPELPPPVEPPPETEPQDTPVPETTVPPTTEPEPTLPEPYPEMEEYVQYSVSYDLTLQHSSFARSNRICQFVTDWGDYRLAAQIPELFINWESYYYDVKEDTSNSLISISHYEEGWSIWAWVFTEQVESMYQGFPIAMDDGTELWFYVAEDRSTLGENDLQTLFARMLENVTLSQARDDGWGKVRIGETMISHNSQYWNGLAYTANSFDYWAFEQILDSHALSGYDLRHAGSRVVNGIQWDFYTLGSPSSYAYEGGKHYYFTRVFAVAAQEDIWLETSLSYGLSPSESLFASQAEYEAYIDKDIHFAIDTIVRDGLSNYYLYP